MRIQLEEGKQKELIFLFKYMHNYSWNEFAEALHIKVSALKEWHFERCLLPMEIFEQLNEDHSFDKYVTYIKNENWGQSRGGHNSPGNTKKIFRPQKNKELSELIGIILGDGNINIFCKGKNIATYALRICGHAELDFNYLHDFVSPLIKKLFHIEPTSYNSKINRGYYVISTSKELIEFLLEMGLKSGRKTQNQVTIPTWIKRNKIFSISCIRGLIDTDGSIFRMSQRDSTLLRISFKNHNKKLLEDVRETFIQLCFHPSKIITGNTIFISRKDDIENYIRTIGFHNPKHLIRLKKIAPWCREISKGINLEVL